MKILEILRIVERVAPPQIQESWDNTGLQVGSAETECTGITLCVDCTPEVLDDAIARNHNLIISHHPLIFKPLKRLTGSSPTEAVIMNAIAAGVTIYSTHTALDSTTGGISHTMAAMLGLEDVRILDPRHNDLLKLTVFVPDSDADRVRLALFDCGAGKIGNYDSCSFGVNGEGTFRALDGATPAVGELFTFHTEKETRLELILPRWKRAVTEDAIRQTHPYEEPAFEFTEVVTGSDPYGLGTVGILPAPMTARELALHAREVFGCETVRVPSVWLDTDSEGKYSKPVIRRVAVCGGAGGSLIEAALRSRAQAFVTGDLRHHDFIDYGDRLCMIDVGHFEGEKCSRNILFKAITEIFPNFAVTIAKNERNPIKYL